jgi:tetratricopeptide (TPR) repeat protein
MRRWLLGLAAIAGVAVGGPVARAQAWPVAIASPQSLAEERVALDKALADARGRDAKLVDAEITAVLAAPSYPSLGAAEQHASLLLAGAARLDLDDPKAALVFLRRVTALFQPLKGDWHLRLTAAYRAGDIDDSALCLETIARRWPVSLDEVRDATVFRVTREVASVPGGPERKFSLLEALYGANWRPSDAFLSADRQWRELAQLMIDRGQLNRAGAVAETVAGPYALIEMRADRRFDPVIDREAPRFEAAAAAARRLETLQVAAADQPYRLSGLNAVAGVLIETRRTTEALKLLDDTLARATAADASFIDAGEELAWTMDYRARALVQLGRFDDAVAQWRAAAGRSEGGRPNVSQTINLASLYLDLGRAGEAAAVAGQALERDLSPFGAMQAQGVLACALQRAGDRVGAARALAYLRRREADAPPALQEALLCMGALDEAARLYVARLDDPERRAQALVELQDYVRPPAATPVQNAREMRRLTVRARPEVRAAIARVGRIERYNLLPMAG